MYRHLLVSTILGFSVALVGCSDDKNKTLTGEDITESSNIVTSEDIKPATEAANQAVDEANKNLSDVELNQTEQGQAMKEEGSQAADAQSDVTVSDTIKEKVDIMKKGAENVANDLKEGADTMKKGLDNTLKDITGGEGSSQ